MSVKMNDYKTLKNAVDKCLRVMESNQNNNNEEIRLKKSLELTLMCLIDVLDEEKGVKKFNQFKK